MPLQNRLARPQSKGASRLQNTSAQARSQRTSPLVYLCRLLILGVGIGAIAGTVISVWNPSVRNSTEAGRVTSPITAAQQSNLNRPGSAPGTLATIANVRIGRELTDLVAKVTPLTQSLTDLVPGVFLMDLDSGDFFSFNGNSTFSSASMIKLPVLVAFFQDVDAGKVKLDETLAIQQSDVAEGSGDMQYAGVGTQFTALDTATKMIINSDNTATNMVIRRLGGIETVNRRFQQWGLQQTLLRKPLPDLEGTNTTSPKELVSLLALLNDGKLISMKSRDRAFDIMRHTVTDTLLPSVMAPGSTIAHKTGDIGSMVGDVGIIDMPSGCRYAVAMMVKRPNNDSRAQDLIRQMAAVVYEHFGGQPVLAPSPVISPGQTPQQVVPGMVPGTATPGATPTPGMPQPTPSLSLPPTTATPTIPAPTAPASPEAASPTPVAPPPSPEASVEPTSPEPAQAGEPPQAETQSEPPADQERT